MVNAKEWEKKLREEGFRHFFSWQDGPNAYYPDHTHPVTTAHVILEGERLAYRRPNRLGRGALRVYRGRFDQLCARDIEQGPQPAHLGGDQEHP